MIGDWIKLARLSNALVAGIGVWLGHACLPGPINWTAALLGFGAMTLLAAAGNMHNDVLDLAADLINRPQRPLPAGRLTSRRALQAAIAIYLTGIVLAGLINIPSGLLAAGMALLLGLYNFKLKSMPLWGNLAVAVLCALALYFPEFPGLPIYTGLPALFAFLATMAREIAKDAEDIAGDAAVGRNTFPIRFGNRATRIALHLLTSAILLLLPLPYLVLHYHPGYVVLVLVGPMPLLISVMLSLSRPLPAWGKIQRHFKIIMLAGMSAIFAGIYF